MTAPANCFRFFAVTAISERPRDTSHGEGVLRPSGECCIEITDRLAGPVDTHAGLAQLEVNPEIAGESHPRLGQYFNGNPRLLVGVTEVSCQYDQRRGRLTQSIRTAQARLAGAELCQLVGGFAAESRGPEALPPWIGRVNNLSEF